MTGLTRVCPVHHRLIFILEGFMKRVLTFTMFIAIVAIAAGCSGPADPARNNNAAQGSPPPSPPSPPTPAAPPTTGGIKIASTPGGASILLMATDESGASAPEPRGTTPITLTDLSPGKYAVHLELKGYKSFQKEVEVKAGEVVPVVARMQR